MSEIVLLSDKRVAGLPVDECGDRLVDLRDVEAIRLDPRLADADGAYAHLRLGLAGRLVAAQSLLPRGLRLLVVEGYRPPALQERYFAEYTAELRRANPDWPAAHVHRQASRYTSPPDVAPHVAGAAVDLTLCTDGGDELPMGTPVNASPEESDGACNTGATNISDELRDNRRILTRTLNAVGLVNYPTEWWHWSFGDRYWAFITGAPAARYGALATAEAGLVNTA